MDQNKYYKTNSFYLAAFLLSKDVPLLSVNKNNFNKASFNFPNSNEVQGFVRVFNFSKEGDYDLLVDFKKTETSIKRLKSLIYD